MGMINTTEGILIGYNEYEDGKSLLTLYDVQTGGIVDIPSTKHPTSNLGALFSELEQLCQKETLTLATAKPVFQKYGL